MNKLISRNPILRFKEGKKILKFQNGNNLGVDVGASIASNILDSNRIAKRHDYGKGEVTYVLDGNGTWYARWNDSTRPNLGYYRVAEGSTGYNRAGDHNVLRNGKWVKITTPTQKNAVPVDWNKNYDNFKNGLTTALRAWLTNLGVKYDNAKALQEFLNNKGFGNRGTQGLDGKWGTRSLEAWNKLVSQTDFTPKVNISPEQIEKDRQTIINLVLPLPKLPAIPEGGISNFTPLSTTYNRAGVRDFIRNKGVNPYSFTGDQRRALRMVMNGQGTDEDKALVLSMGIFKKGGQLPSRNPITRFKNRNFS